MIGVKKLVIEKLADIYLTAVISKMIGDPTNENVIFCKH